ncbi:hypothetical protein YC2023_110087 [Brassica napus]
MATGVWIDQSLSIKPSFKEVLENSFKGNCSHVDFFNKPAEVIDEVNTWAEFPPMDSSSRFFHAIPSKNLTILKGRYTQS